MSGAAANNRLIQITNKETHAEYYDNWGEWLPLSVWGQRGFDVESIRAKAAPSDRKPCDMFGELFRVRVSSSGERGERGATKDDTIGVSVRPSAARCSRDPAPLAIEDGPADSDSTSSSSSSHRRRKHKKDKRNKDKKHKKVKKSRKNDREDPVGVSLLLTSQSQRLCRFIDSRSL